MVQQIPVAEQAKPRKISITSKGEDRPGISTRCPAGKARSTVDGVHATTLGHYCTAPPAMGDTEVTPSGT